jgi:hypothetical protein
MRYFVIMAVLGALLASGCYVMEYSYDPYYDGYYSDHYYPTRTAVRYYSPIEPLVDMAILGAALYGLSRWSPRHYHAPSYRPYRVRR